MILAIATVTGFQNGIKEKVIGAHGHLIIENIENAEFGEPLPLDSNELRIKNQIRLNKYVKSANIVCAKPCIAKGESELDGIVAKGVENEYDFAFIKQHLIKGRIPNFSEDKNQILISQFTANRLQLDTGQVFQAIFFKTDEEGNTKPKAIAPTVVGVFNTGLDFFDKSIVYTHITLVKKSLNGSQAFTNFEILLHNHNQMDSALIALSKFANPEQTKIRTAKDYNRDIFEWLAILDTNVVVILGIMLLVACINICTTLLILVTERTQMVGLLKAMGSGNFSIRQIFVYKTFLIAGVGLLLGNAVGLGICWLQNKFGFIKLSPKTYYISKVVTEINWEQIAILNTIAFAIIFLVLFIPSLIISKMNPIKSIRFS